MARGNTQRTWVPGADGSGFGIEHLPYGVVRAPGTSPQPAARIGDRALLLAPLAQAGLLDTPGSDAGALRRALQAPTLNPLLELGRPTWSGLRARLTELIAAGNSEVADAGLERGQARAPRRRAALPQLAPPPRRLPRPRGEPGPQRHPSQAPGRTDRPGDTRRATRLRARASARFRARARLRQRPGTGWWRAGPHRRGGRAHLRLPARQRLERPLDPGLGVPPARPLPRQGVRHLDRGVDHAARGARALSRSGP